MNLCEMQMGLHFAAVCVFFCLTIISVKSDLEGTVFINGEKSIAETDENFICATLDWWPPEKCDYGNCSWGNASLLNLDLNNNVFLNAVKAFSPLKLRLGGSLQDKVIYQTKTSDPCKPFIKKYEYFGFTNGCLPLSRWDELNSFFKKSEALVVFGLNALYGKTLNPNRSATGPWDPSNAASLISYTAKKGYQIYGWELGNELSGKGISIRVDVDSYVSDTIALHRVIQDVYKNVKDKPRVLGPGGYYDAAWFNQYLVRTSGSLYAITHHIYNLGPGGDEHLIDKILNPDVLDKGARSFINLQATINTSRAPAVAWVGEAGGAFKSGRDKVTNAFVFSFWYLDQLGASAKYDTKTYCRQSLIGGNYGLLNTKTFNPNPDYYSALLWHRLMGRSVLSTNFTGTRMVRAYSHCAKQSRGITLLLINLDGKNTIKANLNLNETTREEYHLTPSGGDIQSQTVLLNGEALRVGPSGAIPDLKPVTVRTSMPIVVAPFSIVFVHLPNFAVPACA